MSGTEIAYAVIGVGKASQTILSRNWARLHTFQFHQSVALHLMVTVIHFPNSVTAWNRRAGPGGVQGFHAGTIPPIILRSRNGSIRPELYTYFSRHHQNDAMSDTGIQFAAELQAICGADMRCADPRSSSHCSQAARGKGRCSCFTVSTPKFSTQFQSADTHTHAAIRGEAAQGQRCDQTGGPR
eukprot:11488-Rhodomonas_salina.1